MYSNLEIGDLVKTPDNPMGYIIKFGQSRFHNKFITIDLSEKQNCTHTFSTDRNDILPIVICSYKITINGLKDVF